MRNLERLNILPVLNKRVLGESVPILGMQFLTLDSEEGKLPDENGNLEQDKELVIKKLGLTAAEFEKIMSEPPREHLEYPSNNLFFKWVARWWRRPAASQRRDAAGTPIVPMCGVNLHIYQSTFTHASRMLKITKTLADVGIFPAIAVLARWEPGLPQFEQLDSRRQVWRVRSRFGNEGSGKLSKTVGLIEWFARLLWRVRRLPVDCINCHSLVVLPLCVCLKWLKGAELVYDTHELETETSRSTGLRRVISKLLERSLIRHADRVVVVGEAIADWYRNEYGLERVFVVRNTPYARSTEAAPCDVLRRHCQLSPRDQLFIYHGVLFSGRGIDLTLRVFARLPANKHLVLMGFGPLVDRIKEYERTYGNIHFHPAVRPEKVPHYAASADVGLSLIENVSLSYYYCLPNKVFEYLNSGVPIIVSDFPEMGGLVDRGSCGWKVSPNEEDVTRLINRLSDEEIASKREAVARCAREFVWEREEPTLLSVYRGIAA